MNLTATGLATGHILGTTGPMTGATAASSDTTPPAVAQRPADGLAVDADIVIVFNEAIQAATGTVTLRGPDGVVYTADVAGPDVTVSGNSLIFNPPQQLAYLTNYSVEVSTGAIKDLTGNTTATSLLVYFSTGKSQVALNATGTEGPDTMHGSELADVLSGAGGSDHLYGYGGDDVLNGGDEPDSTPGDGLYGGDGNDTLYGNAGNDYLEGNAGNDKIYGGTGNDNLDGGNGDDLLDGGAGNDRLDDFEGTNTLFGGEGNDGISVSSFGTNHVDGGPGNDVIIGGWGDDTLAGGAGNDTITVRGGIPQGAHTVVVSGGDGDDLIIFQSNYYGSRLVTANGDAGADVFQVSPSISGKFTIAGFSTAEGDKIDLLPLVGRDFQGNPFGAAGYFKAEQSGSDTVISYDYDGSAGTVGSFQPLFILQNVQLASLGGGAFAGGFDPLGDTAGMRLQGTAGDDTLRGGPLGDTLDGGDGADTLWGSGGNDNLVGGSESAGDKGDHVYGELGDDTLIGGAGADVLDGGAGNDQLDGGSGNDLLDGGNDDDTLDGGSGDDQLVGGLGNDRLVGGDGNDSLVDAYGNNYLDGGAGDDTLTAGYDQVAIGTATLDGGAGNDKLVGGSGNDTLLGGAGKDRIEIVSAMQARTVTVDGGADDDTIVLLSTTVGHAITVSGGAGSDTYAFSAFTFQPTLTISDFTAGTGGDKLDVLSLFPYGTALSGNPFGGNQYLRLLQSGTDTLLQFDRDGVAGPEQYRTVAVLKGLSPAALTAANFSPGVDPAGAAQAGSIDGTPGNDVLTGSPRDDTISGGAGDDTLYGYGGNDHLDGGDGRDTLDGENGDDSLLGGGGNDTLLGGPGNDRMDGGAGDDTLRDAEGNNVLIGGAGNDVIESSGRGANRIDGSDGNDRINSVGGDDTIDGGDGDDVIAVSNAIGADAAHSTRINGGAGADWISFNLSGRTLTTVMAAGGQGEDHFNFLEVPVSGTVTITDFQVGEGGDHLAALNLFHLSNLDANPFGAAGFLRFEQRGADAVLQVDVDGAAGPGGFKDVVTLAGIDARTVTAGNIDGGYNPDGTNKGRTVIGTEAADQITGGRGDDDIRGAGGNDVLSGSSGNDHIDGGDGDDVIDGGDGDDVLLGGPGNDRIDSSLGADTADGGDGDDQLISTYGGNKTFSGGAGNDILAVSGDGISTLQGGAGDDKLTLSEGFGTLDGGDGNDRLSINYWAGGATVPKGRVTMLGGAGDDVFDPFAGLDYDVTATGGTGRDTFMLSGTPSSYTVTDFQAGAGGDRIALSFSINPNDPKNPFGEAGYYRLVQDGADTVLEFDRDGAAGSLETFKPVLRLAGVNAATVVAENFVNFFDPRPVAGKQVVGASGDDLLEGGRGEDKLDGGAGNDLLVGAAGNDTLLGGAGTDTAKFTGAASRYEVSRIPGVGFRVTDHGGDEGSDVLIGMERVMFADQALALDINGVAGQAYRIYRAAFDRAPDLSGMGFWLKQMDRGVTVEQAAAGFITSDEFVKLYGAAPTNTEIVDRLYRNVLHRAPEQGGFDFWVDVLNNKKASLASVLAAFSEGAENKAAVAELIGQGIAFQPYEG